MTRHDTEASRNAGAERAWFGFRPVDLGEKQGLVDRVFDQVAGRYDLMNDLMSGGMHRLWKDAMVAWLGPPRVASRGYEVLDVAGGTGDIAFRIAGRSDEAMVTVADINDEMLKVGKARAAERGLAGRVDFVVTNAEDLSLSSSRFDAVTIAFGIRNVPRIDRALREALRVLKPGGRFMCLEFSTVDIAGLDRLYDAFSFNVIPRLGAMVANDADSYRYLVESIRQFPNQARFAAMLADAGFSRVDYRNLSGGIAAIHSGWKL